ncbi:MAG: carboxypeptidase-like regulatory domain-containing protein, partial [Alphaproteobacteria bacterium]|nr:carboxypeptidase-like regulatory domain-containing protein [Alphaproteobacteria bacterium]
MKVAGRKERMIFESPEPQDGAEFDVVALSPDEDRFVVIRHGERGLGKVLFVHPGDGRNGPIVVTLEPLASLSGRVVDEHGQAAPGARIEVNAEGGHLPVILAESAVTDREGKFVVPGLPIGCQYTLTARDQSYIIPSEPVSPRAGATTDAGEIALKFPGRPAGLQGRPAAPREADRPKPDAGRGASRPVPSPKGSAKSVANRAERPPGPLPASVAVTGRIVDQAGLPVAGATVRVGKVVKARGNDLTPWIEAMRRGRYWAADRYLIEPTTDTPRDRQPTTLTDAQGRFRFEGLAPELLLGLNVQGPTIGSMALSVITRRTDPIESHGFWIFGADFTATA